MSKSSSKHKKSKSLKHKEGFVARILKTIFEYDVEFAIAGRKKK